MFLPHFRELELFWNAWHKPRDKTGHEVDGELKREHESEACCDHFPVLLGNLIRPDVLMVTRVPEIYSKLFAPFALNGQMIQKF